MGICGAIDWSATGSMLSALAAVLGLPYIAWQMRMSRKANQDQARSVKLEAKSRLLDMSAPINQLLIEHPEIYDLFYSKSSNALPHQHSVEWRRAQLICEMQANYMEFVVEAIDVLDVADQEPWLNFIHDTVERPVFAAFWQDRHHWYNPDLASFIKRSLAKGQSGKESAKSSSVPPLQGG